MAHPFRFLRFLTTQQRPRAAGASSAMPCWSTRVRDVGRSRGNGQLVHGGLLAAAIRCGRADVSSYRLHVTRLHWSVAGIRLTATSGGFGLPPRKRPSLSGSYPLRFGKEKFRKATLTSYFYKNNY
jgi:hypothetical protein